ncbi:hypothetical protein BC937DRAFT_89173 [Endogone sp. FLAS-F59071]|nr:hypothetical protein BC937DRAFT_89173 [Endogone sp. FLAS-F59071]|eukprot:RUS18075.1 hypothetical protein BC937DRAFT_89173 [Endogone sp. FLAS-F59071]
MPNTSNCELGITIGTGIIGIIEIPGKWLHSYYTIAIHIIPVTSYQYGAPAGSHFDLSLMKRLIIPVERLNLTEFDEGAFVAMFRFQKVYIYKLVDILRVSTIMIIFNHLQVNAVKALYFIIPLAVIVISIIFHHN